MRQLLAVALSSLLHCSRLTAQEPATAAPALPHARTRRLRRLRRGSASGPRPSPRRHRSAEGRSPASGRRSRTSRAARSEQRGAIANEPRSASITNESLRKGSRPEPASSTAQRRRRRSRRRSSADGDPGAGRSRSTGTERANRGGLAAARGGRERARRGGGGEASHAPRGRDRSGSRTTSTPGATGTTGTASSGPPGTRRGRSSGRRARSWTPHGPAADLEEDATEDRSASRLAPLRLESAERDSRRERMRDRHEDRLRGDLGLPDERAGQPPLRRPDGPRRLPGGRPADAADLVLLNTCSVRDRAEQKVYDTLGRLARLEEGEARTSFSASAAASPSRKGRSSSRGLPHVDFVLGTGTNRGAPDGRPARPRGGRPPVRDGLRPDEVAYTPGAVARTVRHRASITVIEGCNKNCTFCVVPFDARPGAKSPARRHRRREPPALSTTASSRSSSSARR